jgi:hypothetical protein
MHKPFLIPAATLAALSLLACPFAAQASSSQASVIGARTPHPNTTPGASLTLRSTTLHVGHILHAQARGLGRGERVVVWDYSGHYGGHEAVELSGGRTNDSGEFSFSYRLPATTLGTWRLCAQSLRSRRVACADYVETDSSASGPTVEVEGGTLEGESEPEGLEGESLPSEPPSSKTPVVEIEGESR